MAVDPRIIPHILLPGRVINNILPGYWCIRIKHTIFIWFNYSIMISSHDIAMIPICRSYIFKLPIGVSGNANVATGSLTNSALVILPEGLKFPFHHRLLFPWLLDYKLNQLPVKVSGYVIKAVTTGVLTIISLLPKDFRRIFAFTK